MVSRRFTEDYAVGMAGFGIPDVVGLAVAVAEGDEKEAIYYAKVMGATHATWLTAWKLVKQYDMIRHGAKNLRGLNFHKVMGGVRFLSTRAVGGPIMLAAAGSMVAQKEVWDRIGDPKTGAVYYARAGTMSGNRGPVIPARRPEDLRIDFSRILKDLAKIGK